MTSKIYPLLFKSGIKRDNTSFQGEYITSGDFIRWHASYLNRMDGMANVQLGYPIYTVHADASLTIPYFYIDVGSNEISVYQFTTSNIGGPNILYRTGYDNLDLEPKYKAKDLVTGVDPAPIITSETLPQIQAMNYRTTVEGSIITTTERMLIVYLGNNLQNINNSVGPVKNIYRISSKEKQLIPMQLKLPPGAKDSWLSGGVLASGDYLFFYGDEGTVLISSSSDSENFVNSSSKSNKDGYILEGITHDKLIYGATTRGGGIGSDYSILFWSLSSIVLVTSQKPDPNETTAKEQAVTQLSWTTNTISSNCSILSSRCVVECDGLFYWPGTDRFFVYNGMVQNLTNNMNQNYFFNNLDMTKRQLVYGVLNSKYKEIWWFYPEKVNSSNDYGVDLRICTHAIIYNINEQTWYDVALTGAHAQYLPVLGNWYNAGIPRNYPWKYSYLLKMNAGAQHCVLRKKELPGVYKRVIPDIIYSNTGTSDDEQGGGNTSNLTDDNYLTRFSQEVINGNILIDFSGPSLFDSIFDSIPYIPVQHFSIVSNHYPASLQYTITISYITADGRKALGAQACWLAPNRAVWFSLGDVPVNISCLRLQVKGQVPFSCSAIEFYAPDVLENKNVTLPLQSFFTTPTMSFVSFSPLKENDGVDQFMHINQIEPDMRSPMPNAPVNASMLINNKEYAQSEPLNSMVYNFTHTTPRITMNYQARNVTFTITSNNMFEMGNWFFRANTGARQ